MKNPILVLCNTNSREEARQIGEIILSKRLAACFDVVPRKLSVYFWPANSDSKEEGRGSLLLVTTLEDKYQSILREIKEIHSDEVPFVAFLPVQGLNPDYADWLEGEIER